MNVLVKDNKVNYTSLATASDGQQFFNKIFTKYRIYTKTQYLSTGQSTSELWLQQYTGLYTKIILTRFHGTITRNDITDGTSHYQLMNTGPTCDKAMIIPVNQYNTTTTFDFTMLQSYKENGSDFASSVAVVLFTLDKNHNKINVPCTINITVDMYTV